MMQLSKEMMKAGLIEEMVADSFDSVMDDDEELDDQAESEVRRLALARVYFTRF
jgi:charged multivesicular body protein 3